MIASTRSLFGDFVETLVLDRGWKLDEGKNDDGVHSIRGLYGLERERRVGGGGIGGDGKIKIVLDICSKFVEWKQ